MGWIRYNGALLYPIRPAFVTDTIASNPHIVIVRFSALGDVVMVSAAVRALQHNLPGAAVTWITSPLAYSLLKGMEGVHFEVMEKPRTLAGLLGKSAQVDRLFGSLRINSQKIRDELGWTPPYTLQQGLRETANWYRSQSGK